jgi:hypothetical protein
LDKWAQIALREQWVEEWVEGAIYPREMVFFLARCEELGITCIVESGRQDGFSTRILGRFAGIQRVKVFSIDYEADAERAARCRERLKDYPELILLKGDANVLIGKTVAENRNEMIALLVDGPKGFWAMSLIFASACFDQVRLIALHNLEEGFEIRDFFQEKCGGRLFYEEFPNPTGGAWEELALVETQTGENVQARRSLTRSSLGVHEIDRNLPGRLGSIRDRRFKLFQPPVVSFAWKLGIFRPTNYLYDISHRFIP